MLGEVSGALWRWFAVLAVSAQVAAVVGGWRGSWGFFWVLGGGWHEVAAGAVVPPGAGGVGRG